jgi:hypothetical protein
MLVMLVALAMVGGKCGKPRPPKEQAEDAAVLAWQDVDVAAELELGEPTVEVVVDDDTLDDERVVTFQRGPDGIEALVVVDDERFLFVVDELTYPPH